MAPSRTRPPFTGEERAVLTGWLDVQRGVALWKAEELSDEAAHRPVIPTSPLMTVAGIISHLRWAEHTWFEVLFLGGDTATNPAFIDDPPDAEMRVDGQPLADICAAYRAQCAASDAIIAGHDLDKVGRHPDYASAQASLRWMVTHVIEETARHAGHLDLIRELLDGRTGYY